MKIVAGKNQKIGALPVRSGVGSFRLGERKEMGRQQSTARPCRRIVIAVVWIDCRDRRGEHPL
jgi:hypothetical protein